MRSSLGRVEGLSPKRRERRWSSTYSKICEGVGQAGRCDGRHAAMVDMPLGQACEGRKGAGRAQAGSASAHLPAAATPEGKHGPDSASGMHPHPPTSMMWTNNKPPHSHLAGAIHEELGGAAAAPAALLRGLLRQLAEVGAVNGSQRGGGGQEAVAAHVEGDKALAVHGPAVAAAVGGGGGAGDLRQNDGREG